MKKIVVALGAPFLLVLFAFFWWTVSLSAVNPKNSTPQKFVIVKGEGIRDVSKRLHDTGLIRDQVAFFLLVKYQLGIEKNIQAGVFSLFPSMTASEIASQLTVGTEDIWVTVPEGLRSEEILELLGKTGNWKEDEGKLFPETYRIPKDATEKSIHDLLRKTFDLKTANLKVDHQVLVLASLVEREAKFTTDRHLVASVLLNRLGLGMKLDIDATIQYIVGKPGNWWPKDLTLEDIKIKSPYNTYLNAGLPPTPICNPGLAAITAVLNPAKTDYLFYVSDKAGAIHFAKTPEEHNQNVAKYIGQ